MEAYITNLSLFALLLFAGLIITYISAKIKLPNILFLIIMGLSLGYTKYIKIEQIIPKELLASLSIFVLIMIIFDSTTKFQIKEVKELSPYAIKLSFIFLITCLTLLTISIHLLFAENIFSFKLFLVSLLFGSLMSGTAPDIILSILGKTKNKVLEILQFESIINTPLTVLMPLIVLDFYFERLKAGTFVVQFLQQIMTGVGTGLILGILAVIIIRKIYSNKIAPLIVIASVLGIYATAENIAGNGILAVTTFGLIFGKSKIREKVELEKFNDAFTDLLTIIVFILVGMLIIIPLDKIFILKSLALFLIFLIIRYISVNLTFKRSALKKKEKIFMALNAPKGAASIVVVFILSTYAIPGLQTILNLILAFIIYTIILSTITIKFKEHFLAKETEKTTLRRIKTKKLKKNKTL